MTAIVIDGKKIAAALTREILQKINERKQQGLSVPGLAVILVGEDAASTIYIRHKEMACKEVGIQSFSYFLNEKISEDTLLNLIHSLNEDKKVHGILVQLPLPAHINTKNILAAIHPKKDVDGFHPFNMGSLAQKNPILRPCTSYGVILLLDELQIDYKNKYAVVVGASNIVGRPMMLELLLKKVTVSICHQFTVDLAHFVRQADILISAVGKVNLIKGEWIKEGAIVIDIGINRLANGKIIGDVEFNQALQKAAFITPVPGGVGPMTVAVLMQNTLKAALINA